MQALKIFSDERAMGLGIISGLASRHAGDSKDPQTVKNFFDKLGLSYQNILTLNQTHSDTIIRITNDEDLANYRAQTNHDADAWLITKRGLGGMVYTADCLPVFIWSSDGKVAALAHCGWQGVVKNLAGKTALAVAKEAAKTSGPNIKLQAYIGPHISSCCFEVKEDFAAQFAPSSIIRRGGKIFVDLQNEVILQLQSAAGLSRRDIKTECACTCTCCNERDFFSFRCDKSTRRMMSFIYLP